MYLCNSGFSSLEYKPQIDGSYNNSVFNSLRNHHSFQLYLWHFHSYQHYACVPTSLPLHQFCYFLVKHMNIHFNGCLIVVLICMSLMTRDVKYFIMCILIIICLYVLFGEIPSSLLPIFHLGYVVVVAELYKFFIYSRYKFLIRNMICKYFISLSFHCLWCAKVFLKWSLFYF